MREPVPPAWVSIGQACSLWGLGKTKLYQLIEAQKIRAVKIGARTLVEVRSGDEFFASLPSIGQRAKR